MRNLEFDVETKMMEAETQWREAYEASISARVDYQKLAASRHSNAEQLDSARERLDRAEALKARIMIKIERLEDMLLGKD